MTADIMSKVEEVKGKIMSSLNQVRSKLPIGDGKFFGQTALGAGKLSGLGQELIDAGKELVSSARTGNLAETARYTPIRNVLERRFPRLEKLPKIRGETPATKVAGIPSKPEAPVRKQEALAAKPKETLPRSERAALF